MQHKEIIKQYEKGKQELRQEVIRLIIDIRTYKAAKLLSKGRNYINDLIHQDKYIKYDTLVQFYEKLKEVEK